MAEDRKRTPKSETLTIRLDPKTRFILDFVARLRGQTITTVVERFIVDGANGISLGLNDGRTWRDFWDVSEGVRALKVAAEPELYPTFEEERRLAFAREHWPFFFTSASCKVPRAVYVNVLWPEIDEFVSIHAQRGDYWRAGRDMQNALSVASLKPPDWPVKPDLDDEIPF